MYINNLIDHKLNIEPNGLGSFALHPKSMNKK